MKSLLKTLLLSGALSLSATAATAGNAILIGYPDVDAIDNFQEYAAAKWFTDNNADGVVIAPGETSKIDAATVAAIWVHIDRVNAGKGNLPAAFTDAATINALKQYVADGGCLLLTKHATQMLPLIGRISADFAPGIYGDGDGGEGADDWTINAQIGWWQLNPDNAEPDAAQYYDRRNHPIYQGLTTSDAFAWETFPMEGTGDPATTLWREDHNCLWDLNAYTYTAEGPNTVVKFENQNQCTVLGTWGHVQDYAVAGVVEFLPTETIKGTILANGLAACEWSPRTGVNAYDDNHKKLTANCLAYLGAKSTTTGAESVEAVEADAPVEYRSLQGVRVPEESLVPGVYVRRQGSKVTKVAVR